jgi:hypothetical protein
MKRKANATIKKHDHYANQTGIQHVPVKPSSSTLKQPGITPPGTPVSSTAPNSIVTNPFTKKGKA